MSVNQLNQLQVLEIIWSINDLTRGRVDIEDSRDIVLPLFFLKALSDQYDVEYEKVVNEHGHIGEDINYFSDFFSFFVPKEARFSFLLESLAIEDNANRLKRAFRSLEENNPALFDLFHDAELMIERLSSKRITDDYFRKLIEIYSKIDLRPRSLSRGAGIGGIFLYLIQRYASASGKKSGEIYTPESITRLLSGLLVPSEGDEIYDPACGSASLLVSLFNAVSERKDNSNCAHIYGQEIYISNYNIARMNLILNGAVGSHIECGDTIKNPAFLNSGHLKTFDIVASVPPFSMNTRGNEYATNDFLDRFKWGIPPKSKSDYAFISHMLASLKEDKGRMAVVVSHGVLFRGAAEGRIRTNIINENLLDAVIGLPQNLFLGTSIPTAIMIFNKRKDDDNVFFIDASKEYKAGKNQNSLSEDNIYKILEAFKERTEIDSFARNVSIREIIDNDFNLNISRYIDDYKVEEDLDLEVELAKRESLQSELKALESEMDNFLLRKENSQ
jgi:type I restriction enzyme M protein